MAKSTSREFTVNNILDNLSSDITGKSANTFSNAQKAFERKTWMQAIIVGKAIDSVHLTELGTAIDALPSGTITVPTFNANTGEVKEKKINYRDVAKNSFSTAWKAAVKDNEKWGSYLLKWKLSSPTIEKDETIKKTDLERIVAILGDAIDSKGIEDIKAVLETSTIRIEKANKECFERQSEIKERAQISETIAMFRQHGMALETAIDKAALVTGKTVEELKKIVG